MSRERLLTTLAELDRHVIYASVLLIVASMTLWPIGLPISVGAETRLAYNTIEKLPSGSIVLYSLDLDIMGWLQGGPQAIAFLQHLFSRPVKIVIIGWRPDSEMLILKTLGKVDTKQKKYGVDYVNLAYVAGGETAMAAFASNPTTVIRTDYSGTSIADISLMQEVKGAKSISLVINPNTGSPGCEEFIRQWNIPYKTPIITSQPPMTVPTFVPYVKAGSLIAALPAIRSSAEYELLIGKPGYGLATQDAISIGTMALLAYIIIGNVGAYLRKPKEAGQR